MSRSLDIVNAYFERYPEPGPGGDQASYDQERRQLQTYLHLTTRTMARHGVNEDVRALVVRDLLYAIVGDDDERARRQAEEHPIPATAYRPPGEGSGWTGAMPAVTPRDQG